jgi:UDPglucose--hexose-1-phosphate uridylyltransferase
MFHERLIGPDGRPWHLYSRKPISSSLQLTNRSQANPGIIPQLRWHPLRGEWVAYSSHLQSPTAFAGELPVGEYDVAVFENPSHPADTQNQAEMIVPTQQFNGVCETVVFSQTPNVSLGSLSLEELGLILQVLGERTRELGQRPDVQYVLPFANAQANGGEAQGFAHGQIQTYSFLPAGPARIQQMEIQYYRENPGGNLLGDLIQNEIQDGRRMVATDSLANGFIPVCARFPYETWVAPVRSVPWLYELKAPEIRQLAKALKTVLMKFEKLGSSPSSYLMVLHQAPTDGAGHPEAHAHFAIYPSHRDSFTASEIGAGVFVNESSPEENVAELRDVQIQL